MLRITHRRDEDAETLTVEGRLSGPWVEELGLQVRARLRTGAHVRLEVAEIRFATDSGAALLRQLAAEGCEVTGPTGYLEELLRTLP